MRCLFLILCASAVLAPARGAAADGQAGPPTHGEPAATITLHYTAELAANVAGGVRKGTRYLDHFSLALDADLDRTIGWDTTTARLSVIYNNGASISDLVGDAQAVSNIETGVEAVRLYDAWIEKRFDSASVKLGLFDLNSEFDVLASASFFTSSAHGIGTDIAQSGRNGPSIFPTTALALRVDGTVAPGLTLRVAAIDGVPGDPAHPGRTTFRLRADEGALLVGEADIQIGNGRILAGHWRYTAPFEGFDGQSGRGNHGWYLRGEGSWPLPGGRTLSAFVRLGTAEARFNPFSRFLSGGVVLEAPFGRADDAIGVSIASALTGRQFRQSASAGKAETVLEGSYRIAIGHWLTVQPTVQYVDDPGASPDVGNALFFGLRASTLFSLPLD